MPAESFLIARQRQACAVVGAMNFVIAVRLAVCVDNVVGHLRDSSFYPLTVVGEEKTAAGQCQHLYEGAVSKRDTASSRNVFISRRLDLSSRNTALVLG